MIEIVGVSKALRNKPILESIDLVLAEGRTHVLLGSSGSGKTTLLRMIAGAIAPDVGSITVGGTKVEVREPSPLADRLGYMTQEGGLFPHMTARENATLVARVRGWSAGVIAARVAELREVVGLDDPVLDRHPRRLSGGQRQRVALMRALFLRPSYLLLDEPLGALDPIIRRELQSTLKRIFEGLRTTVVVVTHDVGEAAFFGDTVTLLHLGRVLQHGPFTDLARRPSHAYVSEFLAAQRPVPELSVLEQGGVA
ncbi:ATP-binding cassette domain-containing protein [Myxococcota bacterium]|nr:ATP-binding cassette domain-containing protein [Myxococcota bacterium]